MSASENCTELDRKRKDGNGTNCEAKRSKQDTSNQELHCAAAASFQDKEQDSDQTLAALPTAHDKPKFLSADMSGHEQNPARNEGGAATNNFIVTMNAVLTDRLANPSGGDSSMPMVSVIIPCFNAMPWLNDCLKSCCVQDYKGPLEVSVYNDASTDGSLECITSWQSTMAQLGIRLVHSSRNRDDAAADSSGGTPADASSDRRGAGGAGRSRNLAIRQSSGEYLCFLDADDVMLPTRISRQLAAAAAHPHALVGGGFVREPAGATEHYAAWANGMTEEQLELEQFREITVILPTWFVSRKLFERAGPFAEASPEKEGEAEDLSFFHSHLSAFHTAAVRSAPSGSDPPPRSLVRVGDERDPVLVYRFLASSGSWRTPRRKLLRIRVQAFEHRVLNAHRDVWERFTVWGAGRDARQFVSELSEEAATRVRALCDVDVNKVGKEPTCSSRGYHTPLTSRGWWCRMQEAQGPVVVCVSKRRFSDDLDAELLRNVATLGLTEGHDLWFFI